ncbi:MAG: hypothetical protein ACXQTI_03680 [Candidatus Nezhaarchaeales archaeon]
MILMFDNSAQCVFICSALNDPAKRRILEALSRGPLTLETLASMTGVSDVLIRDIVSEMESMGLTKIEEVEEKGIRRVFARALIPIYYDGDVEGLEELIEEASNEILDIFLKIVDKRQEDIERAFSKNEGRYMLSSLITYCFAAAFKKACKELNEGREEEEREAMKAWVKEEAKSLRRKKR